MKTRLKGCSHHYQAATLIEVLTGLAILGSVTVALLLARGNLLEQYANAQLKLEAVTIADQLIAGWYAQDGIPINEQGEIEAHQGWSWQTHTKSITGSFTDDDLPGSVVSVELYHHSSSTPDNVVITIELLVSDTQDLGEVDGGVS